MDAIEVLELCRRASYDDIELGGSPTQLSASAYVSLWRLDPARVRQLLDELLCGPKPDQGLEVLMQSGALHALLPELVALQDLGDADGLHKQVWAHTKNVVVNAPATLELRWASLMHDIGKARTRKFVGNKVTFHNHDVVGARMFDALEHRLDLFSDNASLFTTVRALVLNHLRPGSYRRDWSDSGVRRLLNDLGGPHNFERLMALSRADLTTKNPNKRDRAIKRGNELEARVRAIYAQDTAPKLPKGTMGRVLDQSGRRPGKWLNDTRDELERLMAAGDLPLGETIDFYVTEGLRTITR